MNENTLIIQRLQAAKSAIEQLLLDLGDNQGKGNFVKTCKVCGDPIYSTEPTQRGVHKKCVGIGLARVKSGEWTQEELDKRLDPPAKPGRKRKELAQQSVAERANADVDKKLKQLGATKKGRNKEDG